MSVPQFWRLKHQNYRLAGEVCTHCGNRIFPPRAVCPECHPPLYELTLSVRPHSSNEREGAHAQPLPTMILLPGTNPPLLVGIPRPRVPLPLSKTERRN